MAALNAGGRPGARALGGALGVPRSAPPSARLLPLPAHPRALRRERRRLTHPPPQVPNGELSSAQLRMLAECIEPYGEAGCGDITTRANIQLRGIPLDDASSIINALEAHGLTSFMTGMDNVRNLTGSPIAGRR